MDTLDEIKKDPELRRALVSILTTVDNYFVDRYCIETMLGNCAETEVEILVVNNTADESILKFLHDIINAEKHQHLIRVRELNEITINKAAAYNKLISIATGEYICIFDSRTIVSKGWLYDLIYYHSLIPKVGGAAIPSFSAKKHYAGLLDKNDEIIKIWQTDDHSIDGVALFKADILNQGNCFDENNEHDFMKNFTFKLHKEGELENFFVPGQVLIKCS